MKKTKSFLLGLIAIALLFCTSCSNKPNDTDVKTITEKATAFTPVKDATGKIVANELKDVQKVVISPTWGQSFHYAFASGRYALWLVIGLILVAAGTGVLYGYNTDRLFGKASPTAIGALAFLIFAGAIGAIYTQPGGIKWNNNKTLEKTYFDKVVKEEGSSKRLWDSVANHCLLVDGPTQGCK